MGHSCCSEHRPSRTGRLAAARRGAPRLLCWTAVLLGTILPALPSRAQPAPHLPPPKAAPAPASPAPAAGPKVQFQAMVLGKRQPLSRGAADFQIDVGALAAVPRKDAGDLLKLAPGVLLTNDGSEAHADQVFLRG